MSQALAPKLRVIGRYTILKELRRERHSVSYAAVDPVMNRQLVVKAVELLPDGPRLTVDERRRVEQAFVRQAQAAGRLHHPHIVTVFDAGLSHAFGFLVIERVNGHPLSEMLSRGQRPSFVHCASIAARVADALACAHGNGVAHGHLGPQHVFVQADGSPKVSGFGGWIDDGASGDEALAGTARLLPYFQNEITEETRLADLHALAILLFMLVAGRAPATNEVATAISRGQSPTLLARADAPRALARLLDAWLDPAATARTPPLTASAMRDALTAFLWEERPDTVSPSTLGIPLAPPPERPPVHTAHIAPANPANGAPSNPRAVPRSQAAPPAAPALAGGAPIPPPAPPAPAVAAPATGPATPASALPVKTAPGHADAIARLGAMIVALRPWARENRTPLWGVGGLLGIALLLGVLLGNLHRAAPADPAPVAAEAQTPEAALPAVAVRRVPVAFRIRPWGEILIDGRPTGVSPPMAQGELSEGYHVVEVRHGDLPAWTTRIEVRAGAPVVVEHDFP
jgi:hypothetical protein